MLHVAVLGESDYGLSMLLRVSGRVTTLYMGILIEFYKNPLQLLVPHYNAIHSTGKKTYIIYCG